MRADRHRKPGEEARTSSDGEALAAHSLPPRAMPEGSTFRFSQLRKLLGDLIEDPEVMKRCADKLPRWMERPIPEWYQGWLDSPFFSTKLDCGHATIGACSVPSELTHLLSDRDAHTALRKQLGSRLRSRGEHIVEVALAVEHLRDNLAKELSPNDYKRWCESDYFLLHAWAFCHDLGHRGFSHLWELGVQRRFAKEPQLRTRVHALGLHEDHDELLMSWAEAPKGEFRDLIRERIRFFRERGFVCPQTSRRFKLSSTDKDFEQRLLYLLREPDLRLDPLVPGDIKWVAKEIFDRAFLIGDLNGGNFNLKTRYFFRSGVDWVFDNLSAQPTDEGFRYFLPAGETLTFRAGEREHEFDPKVIFTYARALIFRLRNTDPAPTLASEIFSLLMAPLSVEEMLPSKLVTDSDMLALLKGGKGDTEDLLYCAARRSLTLVPENIHRQLKPFRAGKRTIGGADTIHHLTVDTHWGCLLNFSLTNRNFPRGSLEKIVSGEPLTIDDGKGGVTKKLFDAWIAEDLRPAVRRALYNGAIPSIVCCSSYKPEKGISFCQRNPDGSFEDAIISAPPALANAFLMAFVPRGVIASGDFRAGAENPAVASLREYVKNAWASEFRRAGLVPENMAVEDLFDSSDLLQGTSFRWAF